MTPFIGNLEKISIQGYVVKEYSSGLRAEGEKQRDKRKHYEENILFFIILMVIYLSKLIILYS